MSDILLQNAVNDVKAAILTNGSGLNYQGLLGSSLNSVINGILTDTVTYPSIFGATPPSLYICDLSDVTKISHCLCNYSGSGTSSVDAYNTNNPWTNGSVLAGAGLVVPITIADAIINYNTALKGYSTASTAIRDQIRLDVFTQYKALSTVYEADPVTYASTIQGWYVPSAAQGAALSSTNKLKVCGTNWRYGQGATCTWTVPAGATQAKFQVWGAGMGTNMGCCCGGTSFGENGAYAEMTINVTPGNTYSLCAGCTCSRYCCSSETPGYGCMSGVTGTGICCLKADGAHCYQANCDDMNAARNLVGAGSTCYRFENLYCTSSGPCWCNYGEYCYDNSCATCGVVAVYPSCCDYVLGCSCATTTEVVSDGIQFTHRGMHGGGCLDTNNYGYHIRPPIIDSDTGLNFSCDTGCACQTFTSGSQCGGCLGKDWTYHPGHGGTAGHTMGGANSNLGDTGRGGMVQVSWV